MTYTIELSEVAKNHLQLWRKSGQKKTIEKIFSLFKELQEHPRTGTGQVEELKGDLKGFWSRRINKDSRLVYSIEDKRVIVTVVSLKGHYNDK